jgi:prepilin-type N-terminal cleavage/methylation domain-containing protein/prepilin-type processing-associated H-X9-DG protein
MILLRKKTNKTITDGGFTLIELLVVISIIALLLSILLPSLRTVKEQARTIICKSRHKDLANAISIYAVQNDDEFPANTDYTPAEIQAGASPLMSERWWSRLAVIYFGHTTEDGAGGTRSQEINNYDIFVCPEQERYRNQRMKDLDRPHLGGAWMIGYNAYLTRDPLGSGVPQVEHKFAYKHSQVKRPSEFPVLGDHDGVNPFPQGPKLRGASDILRGIWGHPKIYLEYDVPCSPGWDMANQYDFWGPAPNHRGKCVYTFGDGHVDDLGPWPWSDNKGTDFHPLRNPR